MTDIRESAERVAQDADNRGGTSHREMSPRTPYGLALDLAYSIVERDDEANKSDPRSLRPGLTDEYTLAKHFLIAQEYISVLKNDLEEAENNLNANAIDASNSKESKSHWKAIAEKHQEEIVALLDEAQEVKEQRDSLLEDRRRLVEALHLVLPYVRREASEEVELGIDAMEGYACKREQTIVDLLRELGELT